jgi:hypothetical protein
MKEGTSTTSFTFKDLVSVDYTILANRAIPYSAMAIVDNPKKMEIIANNYMVVPDQLIEAKSQFRVLKDNQYMMPVLELLQNIIWETYRFQRPFLFDGQSEASATGNVTFLKLLKGENTGLPLQAVFVRLKILQIL